MTKMRLEYKYETMFRGPYEIDPIWTNRTVTLRKGAVTNIINICNINTYNDTVVE